MSAKVIEFRFLNSQIKVSLFLGLILILACVLRFYHLDFQSLWYDEVHSTNGADPDLSFGEIVEYSRTDQPPLFFLVLHYCFKIFGFNDLVARSVVAVIGVTGVVAMFFLGKEIKDVNLGLISALLTAINFFHISYSQEVRFYSLLFLLSVFSFFYFIRTLKSFRVLDIVLYIVCISAAIYTHYYGMVLLLAQILIYLIFFILKPAKKMFYTGLLSGFVILIIILPWLPQYFSDNQIANFWIEPVSFPRFIVAYFYHYFESIPVAIVAALVIVVYIARKIFARIKQEIDIDAAIYIVIGWIAFTYATPYIYSFFFQPMMVVRYTIITLPAIIILLSLAIVSFKKNIPSVLLIVIFSFSILNLFVGIHYYSTIKKEQLREVAKEVIEANEQPSVIFSYYAWHYNYYFKSLGSTQRVIHPESVKYETELSKVDHVWLIQCHEDNIGATNEQLNLIKKDFVQVKESIYTGARGVLFKRATAH